MYSTSRRPKAVLEQHIKGTTEHKRLESFAIGSSHSMFAYPNSKCVLVAPPSKRGKYFAQSALCWVIMLLSGGTIVEMLWPWYEVPIKGYLQGLLLEGAGVGTASRWWRARKELPLPGFDSIRALNFCKWFGSVNKLAWLRCPWSIIGYAR